MGWSGRAGRARVEPVRTETPIDAPAERTSPGLAALFDALEKGIDHSVLDLGPARGGHLQVLARFARQVRFAGLVPRTAVGDAWREALGAVPPNPSAPYDVVLAWDLLDRLVPDERALAVQHLASITGPRARLHVIVGSESRAAPTAPRTFTLLDAGRIREEPIGPPEPQAHPLLPAQVERALAPFEVVRAFVVRAGAREYMAMKAVEPRGSPPPPPTG